MIFECHEQCDACYNCLHRGECHWDSERQCMVREETERKERKYGMSRKTCEICKNKAEYFTYTTSPETEERFVIRLCKKHQQLICHLVVIGVQTQAHRYKRLRQ